MIASSLIRLARTAPDARVQVFRMARVMAERKRGPEGACTIVHLFQAGFTEAQVVACRDPARALLQGLPLGLKTDPPGLAEAQAAADAALKIKVARIAERFVGDAPPAAEKPAWAAPVVRELNALERRL